jgi:hypothetical protein
MAEASPYTGATATEGRMARFPSAVMVWSHSRRPRCGPDDRGGGAEKKTLVSGSGGGGFIVHRCDGDGRADGAATAWRQLGRQPHGPSDGGGGQGGAGVDSAASKKARENLVD